MGALSSLALLLVYMAAGFLAARLSLVRPGPLVDRVFNAALYLLLLSMGLRIGQNREILAALSRVGTLALAGALFPCAGTVLLHFLAAPLYRALDGLPSGIREFPAMPAGTRSHWSRRLAMLLWNLKKPLGLLLLVVLGCLAGFFLPPAALLRDGTLSSWLLYFLLFVIGLQLEASETGLSALFARPVLLVIPLVTVAGSLAGSLATLAFDGMTAGKALALGSGFGWYSLSGVLIANLGDPLLGTAAFLANLLRETFAFICIPLLAATGRGESGIGIAGATSMDVTLPVLKDTWGTACIPAAVVHGVILSFLVPFLVPLFMSF
jgi:uncharacterized membrane protein YbjE (DUF340 family)